MKQEQEAPPQRIKIGRRLAIEQNICRELEDFCEFANGKIIPAMLALDLPISVAVVVRYAAKPQQLHSDFIANEVKAAAPNGATQMLREIFQERAANRAEELAAIPFGAKRTNHTSLLILDEAREMRYDVQGVEEAATNYITAPTEIAAYERHQAAVKAMNEFFKGKAPDAWTGLRGFFWLDNAGNVVAAENVDYSAFV